MILKSRVYERKLPDRDATLFVIYCEGSRREHHYFRYFKEISSRINVEVIPADSQGNNSPLGLYEQACRDIDGVVSDTKYELVEGDQVWFVIDTDAWGEAIPELKSLCRNRIDWFVAESNPCFEVWLYYHVFSDAAGSIQLQGCSEWKNLVNARIPGGFDSRKHPMLIGDAILNASVNFRARGDEGVSPYKYALTPSSDPGYAVDHGGTYGSDSRKHIQLWDRTEQQAGLPS